MKKCRREVIVIGAGISGLVCAYRLKRLGVDVLLLEKSSRVGGVIQSDSVDGYLIERGPNSSQGTEDLMMLVDELSLMDELIEGDPKAPAYVYYGKRLHIVPSGAASFLSSRLLSWRGKLRILCEPLVPVSRSNEEETVASFARRRIGEQAANRMVAPFVSGIYAGDAEKLSVQAAFPRLVNLEANYGGLFRGMIAKAREARRSNKSAAQVMDKAAPTRRRLVSFRSGMAELPRTLAMRLAEGLESGCDRISLRADVAADRSATGAGSDTAELDGRYSLNVERAGRVEEISCDHVVIATPSRAAGPLVGTLSNELRDLLLEIDYPPLAIAYLGYDRSAFKMPLDGFGFLAAPSEGLKILGSVWNSSLFEGRAPNGKSLLTVFMGGALNPRVAGLGDGEVVSIAHGELQRILGISADPQAIDITRYEQSIPQYNLGHAARVTRIEELLQQVPGLRLIGNYMHGVSTGDCVKSADIVAREIASSIRQGAVSKKSA